MELISGDPEMTVIWLLSLYCIAESVGDTHRIQFGCKRRGVIASAGDAIVDLTPHREYFEGCEVPLEVLDSVGHLLRLVNLPHENKHADDVADALGVLIAASDASMQDTGRMKP